MAGKFLLQRGLDVEDARIQAGLMNQLLMRALLDDVAILHHQDQIGLRERHHAMADDDGGGIAAMLLEGMADGRVGFGIHGGQGIVEDQDIVALHQGTGNGNALLLAARERYAALAHHRIPAVFAILDKAKGAGVHGRAFNGLLGGMGDGDAHVVAQRLGIQEGLLQHQAYMGAQVTAVNLLDIHAADGDAAALRLKEALHQVYDAALAAARSAQDGHGFAGGDGKAHILQDVAVAVIAEGDVIKHDIPVQGRLDSVRFGRLHGRAEDLVNALHSHKAFACVGQNAAQLADGP